jgi:hypothetical protein
MRYQKTPNHTQANHKFRGIFNLEDVLELFTIYLYILYHPLVTYCESFGEALVP